jgi:hypothetical protein
MVEMRKSKTPDFRVSKGDDSVFYCEVKTSKKDSWLDEQMKKKRVGCIAGGLRNDPIYNRFTDDIHTAVKQFDAVNPDQEYPNVLALVNHDQNCGFLDLVAVITGNFTLTTVRYIQFMLNIQRGGLRKGRIESTFMLGLMNLNQKGCFFHKR